MIPDADTLFAAVEATWPPARRWNAAGFTLRDGRGGGKRVSAATLAGPATAADPDRAAAEMAALGQTPLFMVRDGETALDDALARGGYRTVDPVTVFASPARALTDRPLPPVTAFTIWEPLAIMNEIWDRAQIGPARRAVMARCACKTAILARMDDRPAGVAFAAREGRICMVHALEIVPGLRRRGAAQWIMRAAAFWGQANGAEWLAVLTTQANTAAISLYRGLGFKGAAHYHYRTGAGP